MPQIIFATAFDQYAVRAFDVNAIDYLLKPFDRARVLQALERTRQRLHELHQLGRRTAAREAMPHPQPLSRRRPAWMRLLRLMEQQQAGSAPAHRKNHPCKQT